MTETMTIHQALVELKTLNKRIEDKLQGISFIQPNKHSNKKLNGKPIEEYIKETKDNYKSIRTLIARANAIKQAVVESNAKTMVVIGGKEYPVAIAIYMKDYGMEHLNAVLKRMDRDRAVAEAVCARENGRELEDRADAYVASMYGKAESKKDISEEAAQTREAFIKAQTYELVDPIDVSKTMEELRDQIDSFMVNVDSALSVSNALTTIEVTYEAF